MYIDISIHIYGEAQPLQRVGFVDFWAGGKSKLRRKVGKDNTPKFLSQNNRLADSRR